MTANATPTPDRDDFNQRAIPTIPGQRQPQQPTDDWDAANAISLRFPRQARPQAD
ncbi:hypothetical protein ACIOEX_28620 [Streptomyces sp. NPDC087850]|uniref:hypothetical protein n=1 Tax=Streptomyces sp. NPDC087850 TaxID=3365809 RepID=UPI0038223F8F